MWRSRVGSDQVRGVRFERDRMIPSPRPRRTDESEEYREVTWERIATECLRSAQDGRTGGLRPKEFALSERWRVVLTRGAGLGLIGCPQTSNCKSCEWRRKNMLLDLCDG